MSEILAPCPFCGKKVAEICTCQGLEECENFESCESEGYVAIVCNVNKGGCGASSGYQQTVEKTISAWNRRAKPDNKPLTLDELRQMDGKPIYIHEITDKPIDGDCYGIVCVGYSNKYLREPIDCIISIPTDDKSLIAVSLFSDCGKTYLPYRYKPEQEDQRC